MKRAETWQQTYAANFVLKVSKTVAAFESAQSFLLELDPNVETGS